MENNPLYEAALKYYKLGFSVIPLAPKSKVPPRGFELKECFSKRATPDEIQSWFKKWPDTNIGIATGAISGIIVLDFDKKHNRSAKEFADKGMHISPTACARTAHGGEHFVFKHPGMNVSNINDGSLFGEGVDLKGDGGYIVAAPSFVNDKQGPGNYEWLIPPEEGFAEMPDWLLERVQDHQGNNPNWRQLQDMEALEGVRNGHAVKIAGGLLSTYARKDWEEKAWVHLQRWNQARCRPPLSQSELRSVFDSIKSKEESKPEEVKEDKGMTQAMRLVELVVNNPGVELFRDENKVAFVRLVVGDHKETWQCDSKQFQLWLSESYFESHGQLLQPNIVRMAASAIEGKAMFKGGEHELHNRVALIENAVWYDLADKQNRAVQITTDGWKVIAEPPTLFRRHKHQLNQPEPVEGGDVRDLLQFVNVHEPSNQLLLLVYLVSCFIPGFPHPILYIYGQQGSAKSTLSKLLRRLVDPSSTEVLSLPTNTRDLGLHVSRHHLLFYENVSRISNAVSDMLCIAITGGSISERALFTNGDDFLFSVRTNIGINGINVSAIQPDLLERSILMELKPMGEQNRKGEQELYDEFELMRPSILGAIFTAVSKALQIKPKIKLEKRPRMADFTEWGCAIAKAIGFTQQEFLDAYYKKLGEQKEEALAASAEARLVIALMEEQESWSGTPSQLLTEIEGIAMTRGEDVRNLVKQPNQLTRRLNTLVPNFLSVGIRLEVKKTGGVRIITIEKVGKKEDAPATGDGTDAVKAPQTPENTSPDTQKGGAGNDSGR